MHRIWTDYCKSWHSFPLHRWCCTASACNSCEVFCPCEDFKMFSACVTSHQIPCLMLRELPIKKINVPCVVSCLHSSTKVPITHTQHTQHASRWCKRWFLLKSTAPQSLTCVWNYFSSIWRLWSRQLKKWELQTLPGYSVTDARGTVAGFPAFHSIGTIGTLWKKVILQSSPQWSKSAGSTLSSWSAYILTSGKPLRRGQLKLDYGISAYWLLITSIFQF